ncbi:67dc3336-bb03-4391-b3bd-2d1ea3da9e3f [Sclerotinia trifoliorum]|uniref:67dc3336-bb03-4391-b3bd-2d1ea3da9e3f n=1 Tax=Sclerotinia trifoliorum TaxID=28548 RepID=A0A8H2ZXF5_9HELO|nr:67dc3336-bb03-4391-b3bd-2d1ea3da9e3f [Sclerotinia trifoliorum]
MSTRRSARLSALSLVIENASETVPTSSVAKGAKAIHEVSPVGSKVKISRTRKTALPEATASSASTKLPKPKTTKAISPKESESSLPAIIPNLKKRKAASKESYDSPSTENENPSTPKKRSATYNPLPPVTPTPAVIASMSSPYRVIDDSLHPPPADRLAVLNGTNAPLVTPETHRLLANKAMDEVSPSKPPAVKISTSDILDKALEHLIKVEPKLKPVIEKHPCRVFSAEGLAEEIEPFRALVSGIISQQVSGAAAKSIKAKFVALFNPPDSDPSTHTFPNPSAILASDLALLRTAGLSQRKAEYISGLALKFTNGELTTQFLLTASYEEVLASLIQVRGLGKWSVEMFACFALKRLDVFSTGDLGVQRGMAALLGKDVEKLKRAGRGAKGGGKWKYMGEKEMEEMAEKFSPYRSIFMWYMWRVEDTDITTLEEYS